MFPICKIIFCLIYQKCQQFLGIFHSILKYFSESYFSYTFEQIFRHYYLNQVYSLKLQRDNDFLINHLLRMCKNHPIVQLENQRFSN